MRRNSFEFRKGLYHFPAQESWGKEGKPGSQAEALAHTGPAAPDVPSTTLNILTMVLHRPGEGMLSEGKAWNPNCTGFGFDRGTRRALDCGKTFRTYHQTGQTGAPAAS